MSIKVTGVPGYSGDTYPYPILARYVRQIYDAFRPHCLFWGTDITKMPCSWRQCITMFTRRCPEVSVSLYRHSIDKTIDVDPLRAFVSTLRGIGFSALPLGKSVGVTLSRALLQY